MGARCNGGGAHSTVITHLMWVSLLLLFFFQLWLVLEMCHRHTHTHKCTLNFTTIPNVYSQVEQGKGRHFFSTFPFLLLPSPLTHEQDENVRVAHGVGGQRAEVCTNVENSNSKNALAELEAPFLLLLSAALVCDWRSGNVLSGSFRIR